MLYIIRSILKFESSQNLYVKEDMGEAIRKITAHKKAHICTQAAPTAQRWEKWGFPDITAT